MAQGSSQQTCSEQIWVQLLLTSMSVSDDSRNDKLLPCAGNSPTSEPAEREPTTLNSDFFLINKLTG